MKNLTQMKEELAKLKEQVEILEHREKKKRGVLKEGEFYLLKVVELDYDYDEREKVGTEEYIVFYRTPCEVICMNGYMGWYSAYVVDLLNQKPHYEKWTGKKVSKEEAVKYL